MNHFYIRLDNKVSGIWSVEDRGVGNNKLNFKKYTSRRIIIMTPCYSYSEGQNHWIYTTAKTITVTPNEITIK